jgi:hypothetical protein
VVIGISDPSDDGYKSLRALRDFVNELNFTFEMNARTYFVANRIEKNVNTSKDFLRTLEAQDNYLGFILDRDKMKLKQPIFEIAETDKQVAREQKTFLAELEKLFGQIKVLLDQKI